MNADATTLTTSGSWDFGATGITVGLGVLMIAVTIVLSWVTWRRLAGRRGVLALEILRVVLVCLVVVTLWRPEFLHQTRIDQRPQVAVLYDGSRSMTTRDVVQPDKPVRRRSDWVQQQIDAGFWAELTNRYEVVIDQFSAGPPPPDQGDDTAATTAEAGTDLNAALEQVLADYERLRAVVLLTDGDWTAGSSPVAAATRLRMRDVPVYAVGVGSEEYLPDLVVERVSAPAYGLLGEQVYVGVTVRSHLEEEIETTLSLVDDDGFETSKPVVVPAGGRAEQALFWTPLKEGTTQLVVSVPVVPGEQRSDNNLEPLSIVVRKEILEVLVIETEPRWEYRYLRNALSRDPGVNVDCLLLHPRLAPASGPGYLERFPVTREELSRYDVVFVGDIGIGTGELSLAQAELLKGLVEQQASGLVFLPGPHGRQATLASSALGELWPVEIDPAAPSGLGNYLPSRLALTTRGRGHLLTTLASSEELNAQLWGGLPGFYWHAAVRKSKPGATVLAVHEGLRNRWGRIPLLVTRTAGAGKVLFMGIDSAWRWRRGVEDTYHYRFWGQVVRWMSYQRHLAQDRGFRVFHTPEEPVPGETVTLHVTAFDDHGRPMTAGQVTARISDPGQRVDQLTLDGVSGGWGMFRGQFVPGQAGAYRVAIHNTETDRRIELPITVRGSEREPVGRPARLAILREIAQITRGAAGQPADIGEFTRSVSALPESQAAAQRLRLWCHPLWGGFILLLLAVYWTGRKLMGMI